MSRICPSNVAHISSVCPWHGAMMSWGKTDQPKTPLEWRFQKKTTGFGTSLTEANTQLIPVVSLYKELENAQGRGKLSKKREKMAFLVVSLSFLHLGGCPGIGCGVQMWQLS